MFIHSLNEKWYKNIMEIIAVLIICMIWSYVKIAQWFKWAEYGTGGREFGSLQRQLLVLETMFFLLQTIVATILIDFYIFF